MELPLTFTTSEILNQSWTILKKQWTLLLGAWLVVLLVSSLGSGFQAIAGAVGMKNLMFLMPISIGTQILNLWVEIGLIRLMLKIIRNEPASINDLWSGSAYFLQFLLGMLVVSLVVCAGLLLLIIPGVIWSFNYMFTTYILADEKISFSEAMAQSKAMTKGIEWNLAGFGLAVLGINLLGCLALFLGLIITVPLTAIASYVLYVNLRQQYLARIAVENNPVVIAPAVPVISQPAAPEAPKQP